MKLVEPTEQAPLSGVVRRPTLRELYENHLRQVWRFCRRMGVAEADLDDACQEVFLIAHRKLPEFEGRSSPLVWLLGISVRVAAARRRRVQNTREVPSEGLPEPAGPEVASSGLERSEARVLLDRMLEGLDEAKRAVFVLYELEELSMPEISELLGCPLQTAYSRLHAARRQLEAAIASRLAREEVP